MNALAFRYLPLRRTFCLQAAILSFLFQGAAFAQSTWTGSVSNAWNTAGNWDPSGVPDGGASVIISPSGTYSLAVNFSPTLTDWTSDITGTTNILTSSSADRTLTINGTLTKTGAGALIFRGNTDNNRLLSMTIGTLDFTASGAGVISFGNSNYTLNSLHITTANVSAASGTNTLTFLGAPDTTNLTVDTLNLSVGGAVVIANGGATGQVYSLNVGSLNGTGGVVRASNGGQTHVGVLNLTGTSDGNFIGQITDGTAATLRVTKSGTATQTLGNVGNNYTGGTAITGGTLVAAVNNSIGAASGAVEISGADQAKLKINSGISIGNNIIFSNTNASSSVGIDIVSGTAFRTGTTGNLTSNFGTATTDTTAAFLGGNATDNRTLAMGFSGTSAATNDDARKSDVFSLSGTGVDTFVLQLTTTGIDSADSIGWLNGSTWSSATAGNTGNNASLAQQGFQGSFSAFQSIYGTTISNYVGAYGIDTASSSAWVVLDHGGNFAIASIAAIPEPSTWGLLVSGLSLGVVMVLRRRRSASGRLRGTIY